jgi:hypothetical protein
VGTGAKPVPTEKYSNRNARLLHSTHPNSLKNALVVPPDRRNSRRNGRVRPFKRATLLIKAETLLVGSRSASRQIPHNTQECSCPLLIG